MLHAIRKMKGIRKGEEGETGEGTWEQEKEKAPLQKE